MAEASHNKDVYFVPDPSYWPIIGSVGLFLLFFGVSSSLSGIDSGFWFSLVGAAIFVVMLFGWFGAVIRENLADLYNAQVDRTFRWAMGWFIFSEVMFFAAFFGALFYARNFSVAWLSGSGAESLTNLLIWPGYEAAWPTNGPANVGGEFETISAWELPALNTALLLTSSWTLTVAHHAVKDAANRKATLWLAATVALGVAFLFFQVEEYIHAYQHLNLTLGSGIYGSTFFMLTGFHGAHVTLGTLMLFVIMLRTMRGHFRPDRHFAFEAVAWYWHFVDVVWLGLFIFVYIV
ncbi:MAG: cytochrome c oxidase subunit 3 [Pseudomonadota bacterium]|nr:cytochrome c oxidase subunit 3 [Pseudomonadota bacterium]